ncbi:MAG TPA: copper-binding protein [Terriglobales bacterium]|jgi:protein SCO1/2
MTRIFNFRLRPYQSALLLCLLTVFYAACNHSAPTSNNSSSPSSSSSTQTASAIKHYSFKGKIVAIDTKSGNANIDGDDIPGFMGAMTMQYEIRPISDLQKLHPGDSISADLLVDNSGDVEKYWLENVTVAPAAMPKP